MINEEKQKALEAALGQIEKHYGKGSVMKLGESGANMQVETRHLRSQRRWCVPELWIL